MIAWVVATTLSLVAEGCPPGLVRTLEEELALAQLDSKGLVLACTENEVLIEVGRAKTVRAIPLAGDERAEVRAAVQISDFVSASLAEARYASSVERARDTEVNPGPWRGELVVGAAGGAGGLSVQPALLGSLSYRVWKLDLGVIAAATVRASKLAAGGAVADFGVGVAGAQVRLPFELSTIELGVSLGAGALVVWASGRTATPTQEKSTVLTASFALLAQLEGWKALTTWLSAGAVVHASLSPAPVTVLVPGARAEVGVPVVTFGLGLRFR